MTEEIEKEGWLSKTGPKGISSKRWKKRWCILRGNTLSYFNKEKEELPLGIIPLNSCTNITTGTKAQFQIHLENFPGNTRIFHFMANTESEALEWYTFIQSKIPTSTATPPSRVGSVPPLTSKGSVSAEKNSFFSRKNTKKSAKVYPIFGIPLINGINEGMDLCDVVTKADEYIRKNGAKEEGIFRLSGNASNIQIIKRSFDKGEDVDLSKCNDPNEVAGLLKLYLRELPEPILTATLLDQFNSVITRDTSHEQLEGVKELLEKLPDPNYALVKVLVDLLRHVNNFEESNKMTIANLSVIFAPVLFCSPKLISLMSGFYTQLFTRQRKGEIIDPSKPPLQRSATSPTSSPKTSPKSNNIPDGNTPTRITSVFIAGNGINNTKSSSQSPQQGVQISLPPQSTTPVTSTTDTTTFGSTSTSNNNNGNDMEEDSTDEVQSPTGGEDDIQSEGPTLPNIEEPNLLSKSIPSPTSPFHFTPPESSPINGASLDDKQSYQFPVRSSTTALIKKDEPENIALSKEVSPTNTLLKQESTKYFSDDDSDDETEGQPLIEIHKEGYLTKLGGTGTNPKNWRRRWFILNNSILCYYKNSKDSEVKGEIYLQNCDVKELEAGYMGKKFAFEIFQTRSTKNRHAKYQIHTDTAEELKEWMDSFKAAIQRANEYADIQKEGFLVKQGGVVKSWKRRWFVLKDNLYYYRKRGDKQPIRAILLRSAIVKVCGTEDGQRPFTFWVTRTREYDESILTADKPNSELEMIPIGRKFYLRAPNDVEMKAWVEHIQIVIQQQNANIKDFIVNRSLGGTVSLKFKDDESVNIKTNKIFGEQLATTLSRENRKVPLAVVKMVEFLDKVIDTKNLFRSRADNEKIVKLKDEFDSKPADQVDLSECDPFTICELLTQYFRELPEPLLSYELYDKFIDTFEYENSANQVEAMKQLLSLMPTRNLNLLRYLMEFLARVHSHSRTNKMPASHLASLFGPALLIYPRELVQTLIENYVYLFKSGDYEDLT